VNPKYEITGEPAVTVDDIKTFRQLGSHSPGHQGITSEAASLAGHLALPNRCWIYDNNHITIEGSTSLAFSDDVAARCSARGGRPSLTRCRRSIRCSAARGCPGS